MRRARAAAPDPPARPKAPHPGCGICRGMESSGPPPTHPRTFPHPLEILAARPPPLGFPQLRTAATARSPEGREEKMTESETAGGQGGHLHQP
jgi:hypothetical protein